MRTGDSPKDAILDEIERLGGVKFGSVLRHALRFTALSSDRLIELRDHVEAVAKRAQVKPEAPAVPAPPFDRSAAIARVGFLMPELSDEALGLMVGLMGEVLEADRRRGTARDLTPATLAAEQRAREGPKVVEGPWSGERPRSPHDEPRTGYEATGEPAGPCWSPNPDGSPCQADAVEVRGEEGRCEAHPFD